MLPRQHLSKAFSIPELLDGPVLFGYLFEDHSCLIDRRTVCSASGWSSPVAFMTLVGAEAGCVNGRAGSTCPTENSA